MSDNDNGWARHVMHAAPSEHKHTLAWIIMAILALIFVGGMVGGMVRKKEEG